MNHSLKSPDRLADYRTDRRVLLLAALAVPIGALSTVVAQALVWLIAVITNLAFLHRLSAAPITPEQHTLGAWVILVPIVGALIIGVMARYGSEKIRGHGIPEALEAILLGRSLINPRVAVLKPLSSAISIGTGGPFGAEGPIIMTGGAFGSLFAQLFHLSAAERKTLLVAGAAGGMAAIFATPIAATLLAVELLLFEWKPRSFIPAAVAALVASVLRVPLLGAGPLFPVVIHALPTPGIIALGFLVGTIVGLGSAGMTTLVYWFEDLFQKLPCHWMWWPAIGAVVIGVGGWIDPRVMGVGYNLIHSLLRGEFLAGAVLGLLIGKGVVWAVALGSGTSGGVLAPLLIIGGAIGALLGQVLPAGDPGLWAMVGMAAMMAGTMSAPLTGMIFALELTHDFQTLPVLLAGCAASLCVNVLVMRRSILTEKLARRGQHITREYSVDPFELARVSDVMDRECPVLPATTSIAEISRRIANNDPAICRRQGILLLDENQQLVGLLTRGDIVRALQHDPAGHQTAGSVASRPLVVAYPDELLQDAIARLLKHQIGRLPVVDREQPGRVVGYLGRAAILTSRQRAHNEENVRESGPFRTLLAWR